MTKLFTQEQLSSKKLFMKQRRTGPDYIEIEFNAEKAYCIERQGDDERKMSLAKGRELVEQLKKWGYEDITPKPVKKPDPMKSMKDEVDVVLNNLKEATISFEEASTQLAKLAKDTFLKIQKRSK